MESSASSPFEIFFAIPSMKAGSKPEQVFVRSSVLVDMVDMAHILNSKKLNGSWFACKTGRAFVLELPGLFGAPAGASAFLSNHYLKNSWLD